MKKAYEKIEKKLKVCEIGEPTDWKDGYMTGIREAMEIFEEGMNDLIVPQNTYFVIMYDKDIHYPYVEEMCLYKIVTKKRKSYYFSRNLYASRFNTESPDLVLASEKGIRDRVFFTREQAERAIKK